MFLHFRAALAPDWGGLLHRRLHNICTDYDQCSETARDSLKRRLLILGSTDRKFLIKILVNSWSTSSRYHEKVVHGCLLGCSQLGPIQYPHLVRDDLAHHMLCPRPWSVIAQCSSLEVSTSPSARLRISLQWLDARPIAISHHF